MHAITTPTMRLQDVCSTFFCSFSQKSARLTEVRRPQLHVGRVAARVTACFQFERLLIFMSNVFNSPDAHRSRLPGEPRPFFSLSTCRRRPPRHRSSTQSCQQQQLLLCVSSYGLLAVLYRSSKLITNMRNKTIKS